MAQKIIISHHFERDLAAAITECERDKIFVLCDSNTQECCWPVVKDYFCLRDARPIVIDAGDDHKDWANLSSALRQLEAGKATRHSLLINLGGGMTTDLGGFTASIFKRGINFINVPTTLLAMVDASVGGKTGINFDGLKNEIGVFNEANSVIINTEWLSTLDAKNIRSGYAEMLKHGLISNAAHWAELLGFDLSAPNLPQLADMVGTSNEVKQHIVTEDPYEHGIRKALNLGHTFGHALESLSLKRHAEAQAQSSKFKVQSSNTPLLHGYAVAYGLVCELYLSAVRMGFPTEQMRQTVQYIRQYYGTPAITCDDYPALIELMHHDKKNTGAEINVTLLSGIGQIHINQTVSEEEAREAFDFLREGA